MPKIVLIVMFYYVDEWKACSQPSAVVWYEHTLYVFVCALLVYTHKHTHTHAHKGRIPHIHCI